MSEDLSNSVLTQAAGPQAVTPTPIRVLLLDDREDNLVLRSAILRQKGYQVVTSSSIEEAEAKLHGIDIAVLDYHLGAGKFGTATLPKRYAANVRMCPSSFCQRRWSASSAASPICTC